MNQFAMMAVIPFQQPEFFSTLWKKIEYQNILPQQTYFLQLLEPILIRIKYDNLCWQYQLHLE